MPWRCGVTESKRVNNAYNDSLHDMTMTSKHMLGNIRTSVKAFDSISRSLDINGVDID